MMGRKTARNMESRNTNNKIGIQCVCWFYSQRMTVMFYREVEAVGAHTVSCIIACPVPGISLDSSTLEAWMGRLLQNVGNQLPTYTA
jgi:hypothetical protein